MILMDCTLRDGANVVGKGFDARLTKMMIEGLIKSNIKIIEMGNCLGIGAYEANNSIAPLNDQEYLDLVQPYLDQAEMFLIMSVEPGFGGQAFIPESLDRIRKLQALLDGKGLDADIEVDGGIYHSNVGEVLEAGANVIVSGSGVYKGNIAENTERFMEILKSYE